MEKVSLARDTVLVAVVLSQSKVLVLGGRKQDHIYKIIKFMTSTEIELQITQVFEKFLDFFGNQAH